MTEFFQPLIDILSSALVPVFVGISLFLGWWKKVALYEEFVEGAKEGFEMAVRIIPYLVGMLVAIGMLRASGGMYLLELVLQWPAQFFNVPVEVLPMALMRPLSGSGSLGIMTELMETFGPDSSIGKMVSTMMGSTETTFYVLAVYFGSVKIKKPGISVVAGLAADLTGLLVAVYIWYLIG